MSSSDRPEYVQQNVANWTRANTEYTDASAARAWAQDEITWGVFETPESELNLLGDVSGLDIVELGCGTAYFSAWLARRGARVVGVDPTPAQLATARRLQEETGIEFPLIEAIGEDVPLPDSSFDVVHSEYGASLWADPYRWIPEAARLLRPGRRSGHPVRRGQRGNRVHKQDRQQGSTDVDQGPQGGNRHFQQGEDQAAGGYP